MVVKNLYENVEEIKEISSLFTFVEDFDFERKFKKKYGVDIDEWNGDCSDEEVIEDLLEDEEETYAVEYIADRIDYGYFKIYKLKKGNTPSSSGFGGGE